VLDSERKNNISFLLHLVKIELLKASVNVTFEQLCWILIKNEINFKKFQIFERKLFKGEIYKRDEIMSVNFYSENKIYCTIFEEF
jgi:hypothetical protein